METKDVTGQGDNQTAREQLHAAACAIDVDILRGEDDYAGQLVRDVRLLVEERDAAIARAGQLAREREAAVLDAVDLYAFSAKRDRRRRGGDQ